MAAISKELGLDQPPHLRYIQWIAGAVQGDLGTSFSGRNASGVDRSREVVDLIAPRLSNTLFLASMTAIIAVPISLILGVTSALYRNSIYDRSVNSNSDNYFFSRIFCCIHFDINALIIVAHFSVTCERRCGYCLG